MPVDPTEAEDIIDSLEQLETSATPAEERVITSARRRLEDLI
jgi:hypothetical protein